MVDSCRDPVHLGLTDLADVAVAGEDRASGLLPCGNGVEAARATWLAESNDAPAVRCSRRCCGPSHCSEPSATHSRASV